MRSVVQIDGNALRHNLRVFRQIVKAAEVSPVLKGNAYGHGLTETYQALTTDGQEHLPSITVNYPYEAHHLRTLGYKGRVFIVGPVDTLGMSTAEAASAEVVVGDEATLLQWLDRKESDRPKIHVKIDTGMGRQGFLADEAPRIASILGDLKHEVVGVASHFANVEDVTDHAYAHKQMARFRGAVQVFADAGFNFAAHIGASASTLLLFDSHFDMVRVGISLYGLWPSALTRLSYLQEHRGLADLKPVLSWLTEIATVKRIPKGEFIGYGCTFRSVAAMKIAILPVGYYEGYPRLAGEKGAYVLVAGSRCGIIGRICMNMMMIDVTHLDNVVAGAPVVLVGQQGSEVLAAETLAGWAETIHYELLSCLNHAIPRVVI